MPLLVHHLFLLRMLIAMLMLLGISTRAYSLDYRQYRHLTLGTGTSMVAAIEQDSYGMIYMGNNCGLFSYDGYSLHALKSPANMGHVYCLLNVGKERIYAGTDNGLVAYNYRKARFEECGKGGPKDIRTMMIDGSLLYLGTIKGLYSYNLHTHSYRKVNIKYFADYRKEAVYSLLRISSGNFFIGTYNGLFCYNRKHNTYKEMRLPVIEGRTNVFVNALVADKKRNCIWIGTEGRLYKYALISQRVETIHHLDNNSIKTLALDKSGRLLIGTDNGLFIYDDSDHIQHYSHDARNIHSIINDVVWYIFNDRDNNVWLGTDEGVSMCSYRDALRFVPIADFTGQSHGNHFFNILKDRNHNLWLGGTNGLIKTIPGLRSAAHSVWYHVDNPHYPIRHNRIRDIYQDRDGELWICTDGSIHRYYHNQWINYYVEDGATKRNANWAYAIYEDKRGRMWISSFLGGILIVDKTKLMSSKGTCLADTVITLPGGGYGLKANQMVEDAVGNVWVQFYDDKIWKINTNTLHAERFNIERYIGEDTPNILYADHKKTIWIGAKNHVLKIDAAAKVSTYTLSKKKKDDIMGMAEVQGRIWISNADGIWTYCPEQQRFYHLYRDSHVYSSIYYDEAGDKVYLGAVDGVLVDSPKRFKEQESHHPIQLIGVYVNNVLRLGNDTLSFRFARQLSFAPNETHLDFLFSDFSYAAAIGNRLVYRLNGIDQDWNFLPQQTARISYNNLDYGDYQLQVGIISADGNIQHVVTIPFNIRYPWYLSWWAVIIYILLLMAFGLWLLYFIHMRNRLNYEQKEKKHIIEQSRLKMNFFSTLSHRLSVPLTEIMPILVSLMKNYHKESEKQQIAVIQHHISKLNAMVDQAFDVEQIRQLSPQSLSIGHFDIIILLRRCFDSYVDNAFRKKHITAFFHTDVESLPVALDEFKTETIVNNLLENAAYFTSLDGKISLTVSLSTDCFKIIISDDGCGIPANELPYVCQRYFQSPSNGGNKIGSGMGLYFARLYTDLQGGKLKLTSTVGKGTVAEIILPLSGDDMVAHEKKSKANTDKEQTTSSIDVKFLEKITVLIEENMGNNEFNVNMMCEQMQLGNKLVYRKLKLLTGMTPVEYIRTIRLRRAAVLLKQRNFTVSEVMYMVGFTNSSYFSKCFLAEFGQTPSHYQGE